MKVTTLGLKWPSRESIQANNAVPPTGFTGHPWASPVILNRETKSANMVTVRRRATHASKKRRKEDRSLVFRSSKFHPFRSKFSPKRGADLRPRRGANSSVKSFVQEEEGGGARNARKLNSWRKYRWNEPTNNPRSLPFLLSKSCIQLGLYLIY